MKALVAKAYGAHDVLNFCEVPKPVPRANEVLVRLTATTVNRTDTGILKGEPWFARLVFGLTRPRRAIRGTEFAGVVESLGGDRTDFEVGDRVYGFHDEGTSCHAEYFCVRPNMALAKIPEGMSPLDIVACSEGAFYAQNYLRRVDIRPGDRVLINGVSGGIGSALLQLAKAKGAYVVGICPEAAVERVAQVGGDEILPFETNDFRDLGARSFKFVIDTVGNADYQQARHLVQEAGTYASSELGPYWQNAFYALRPARFSDHNVLFPVPRDVQGCQDDLLPLIQSGAYRPLLDRTFAFEDIVKAHEYVALGHKVGNVLVSV